MARTLRTGILGVSTSGNAPPLQERRLFDRSDFILMKALADAPVLHIMVQKKQKKPTTSVKYFMFEDDYFIQNGTLKGSDASGNDAALSTSLRYMYVAGPASEAANTFLRVGAVLHIPAFQTNQTNTTGTGDGSTDGTVMLSGEDFIVREVVSANVVLVDRGGGAGTLTGNVTAGSGNTLNFEIKGTTLSDASSSPDAISQALEEDYNYREVKRWPWDVSGRNLKEKMYGMPDIQRLAVKNRTEALRNMERMIWTNHRYLTYNSQGLDESHTGGLFEYISDTSTTGTRVAAYDASKDMVMGDATQQTWMVNKNFGLENWGRYIEKALKYGSKNKLGVGGRGFMTELENLLRPYYGAFDWDVDTFGFKVLIAKSLHGDIPMVIEQEWSNGAVGYDYHFACVDMDNIWYRYGEGECAIKGCNNPNSDIHIHREIQANDADHRKDELYADIGWDQKFRKSHSWVIWDGTT